MRTNKKFDIIVYDHKENNNEMSSIPHHLRFWTARSSECGKTSVLLNFIYKNEVSYKIYVFMTGSL